MSNARGARQAAAPNGGEPSAATRCSSFVSEIPLVLRCIYIVCIALYIDTWVDEYALPDNSVSLWPVVYQHQYYRVFASVWYHVGILHLVFNMVAASYLAYELERMLGTLPFAGLVMLFSLFTGVIYVFAFWVYHEFSGSWGQSAVGFSGVLFAMMMVQTGVAPPGSSQSLFGMCNVPTWIYPWVLLIVLQFMMSSVSFVGHLAGILVGWAYVKGLFNWCSVPRVLLVRFEQWMGNNCCRCFVTNPMYYRVPQESPLRAVQFGFTQRVVDENDVSCCIQCCTPDNAGGEGRRPAAPMGGAPRNFGGGALGRLAPAAGGGGEQPRPPAQVPGWGRSPRSNSVSASAAAPADDAAGTPEFAANAARRGEYAAVGGADADSVAIAIEGNPNANHAPDYDDSTSSRNDDAALLAAVGSPPSDSPDAVELQPGAASAAAPPQVAAPAPLSGEGVSRSGRPISRLVDSHPRANNPKGGKAAKSPTNK